MTTHELHPDDWRRLKRLRLAALADAPDAFGSTLSDALGYKESQWRQQLFDLATFTVRVDNRDVGMVRGAPDLEDDSRAFLISMWVAPQARRQNLAQQLVQAVIAWARAAGYAHLLLDVADDNEPAIALYRRMRFQPTGETSQFLPPRDHIHEHRRALTL